MNNRQEFIDKLNKLSKEEMLERYIALLNTEKLTDYVADLEAKFAEKDAEIERLKSKEKKIRLHTKRDWFERCCRLEDKSISLGLENIDLKQSQNQTAIDELKKVKKRFNGRLDNFYLPLDHRQTLKEVFEQINQQIKELKGETNE